MDGTAEQGVAVGTRRGAGPAPALLQPVVQPRLVHEGRAEGPAHTLPVRLGPGPNVRDLVAAARPEAALTVTRALQAAPEASASAPPEGRLIRAAAAVILELARVGGRLAPLVPTGVAGAVIAVALGADTRHRPPVVLAGLVDRPKVVDPKPAEVLSRLVRQ